MSMGGASAATSIVGGELSGWANLLDKWAMQDAYNKEMNEQAGYRAQATDVFNKNLPAFGSSAATQQIGQGATNRLAQYKTANRTPLGIQMPNQTGRSAQADLMRADMLAQPRAAYGGYGDWMQNTKNTGIQEGRDLGQISNFAGGNAAVFPYMMYDAQHSWDQLAEMGAAISSIGGGAANYAQFSAPPQQTQQPPQMSGWGGQSQGEGIPWTMGPSAPATQGSAGDLTGSLW